jgi:hypothetical protein
VTWPSQPSRDNMFENVSDLTDTSMFDVGHRSDSITNFGIQNEHCQVTLALREQSLVE